MKRRSFFKLALGAAVALSAGLPAIKAAPTAATWFVPESIGAECSVEHLKAHLSAVTRYVWEQRFHSEYLALAGISEQANTNSNAPGAILESRFSAN